MSTFSIKGRSCIAAAAASWLAASAFGATATETFDADPVGWLREGAPNGASHNFGFQSLDNTGTTPNPPLGTATGAGEAGGVVSPRGAASYGADLGGQLTLNDPLHFSGIMHFATSNQESQLGFYNSAQVQANAENLGGVFIPQTFGIRQVARGGDSLPPDGTIKHTITAFVGGAGSTNDAQTRPTAFDGDNTDLGLNRVVTALSYAISFDYDPWGGTSGNGEVLITIPGVISVQGTNTFSLSLNAAQRNSDLTFDRFGITPALLRDGGPETVYYDDLTYTVAAAPPTVFEWNVNSGGNWSVPGNWTPGVPNAAAVVARFGNIIGADAVVTNDAPHSVGTMQLDNANSYTIAGPATLTLAGAGGGINVVQGDHTISAPLALSNHAGINVAAGSTLTITDLQSSNVNFSKQGGGNVVVNGVRAGGLHVNGGEVQVLPSGDGNANLSRVTTFSIAGTAKLDLTDNKVIITAPNRTGTFNATTGFYTAVSGLVDRGRGPAGNALWDGNGLLTSDTRAINNGDLVSIGVAQVSQVRSVADTETTTFAGETVLGTATIAMVTWGGDANLDGKINIDDYGRIDGNVGQSGTVFGWDKGDFNYDGKINIDDYGIIDGNINRQGTPFSVGAGVALDGASAVPEPAGLAVVAVGAIGLLRRRRRVRSARSL